jgi:hypothetical protein
MSTRTRLTVGFLLAACSVGCMTAQRVGDRAWRDGDFAAAAVAYEELAATGPTALAAAPELAFRLALAHAVPGHQASDLARARALLAPLLAEPVYRPSASALLAVIAELDALRSDHHALASGVAVGDDRLRQCEEGAATCDHLLAEERRLREQLATSNDELRARVAALEASESELAARLQQLADELAAIKRIDLERTP